MKINSFYFLLVSFFLVTFLYITHSYFIMRSLSLIGRLENIKKTTKEEIESILLLISTLESTTELKKTASNLNYVHFNKENIIVL